MTPYFFGSLLLHALFIGGMIWGGIRFAPERRPLPSATVVRLIRPAAPPASSAQQGAEVAKPEPPKPKKRLVTPPKKKATIKKKTAPKKPPPVATQEKSNGKEQALTGTAGTMRVSGGFTGNWYLALVQSKIEQNFRPPPGRRKALMTIMEFRISKRGDIVGLRRKQSSGDFLFDQAAERAVRGAGRFPPLPANFDASELGINFEFVSNPSR